jgi:hypothetical protein
MTKPLRLHWSRSKPNFGDWLSPALCEALSGRSVTYAAIGRCDLVAVGSLFERLPRFPLGRRLDVWGTGAIEGGPPRRLRHRLHALRGPLTAGLVRDARVEVFGDPGLLAEVLLPDSRCADRPVSLGIVPHYKDVARTEVRDLIERVPGARVIDVFDPPARVIRAIAGCRRVISSSLHGLIVAEAVGVRAHWMMLSDAVRGGGWKFRDYYLGTGREPRSPLNPATVSAATLEALFDGAPPPDLGGIKQSLRACFPYQRSAAR